MGRCMGVDFGKGEVFGGGAVRAAVLALAA
jgi:hypothetical protein